jgi:hypothetical protein
MPIDERNPAMSTRRTVCAAALPAFPLVLLIGTLVSPTDSTANATQLAAAAAHGAAWSTASLLELLAAALMPLAAAGVAMTVGGRGARLANTGAALAILGTLGMAGIAFRHVFIYGLAAIGRQDALHALDRVDHVFGPVVLPLMFAGPFALILLAAAVARAGLASRWVVVGAILFFVSDMLPIPAGEELQGIVGIVTFAVVARCVARRSATVRTPAASVALLET